LCPERRVLLLLLSVILEANNPSFTSNLAIKEIEILLRETKEVRVVIHSGNMIKINDNEILDPNDIVPNSLKLQKNEINDNNTKINVKEP
jgi:hypothetical protein